MSKIRVLCVDDSALMRQLMTEIVNGHPDMEMVATAPDPLVARDLIKKFNPQVLTLDVEMPRMDGLDFLEKLMRLRPMPVVMVSSLTGKGSEITLRALELGAVDFVTKPQLGIRETRRVVGEYTLTEADILGCADFADTIGVQGWPVEQHAEGDDLHRIRQQTTDPHRTRRSRLHQQPHQTRCQHHQSPARQPVGRQHTPGAHHHAFTRRGHPHRHHPPSAAAPPAAGTDCRNPRPHPRTRPRS